MSEIIKGRRDVNSFKLQIREFFRFLPIGIYFFVYWFFKSKLREFGRKTAAVYVTIAFLALVADIGSDLGYPYVRDLLLKLQPTGKTRLILFSLFWLGVFILMWQHISEMRSRKNEYASGNSIWALFKTERNFTALEFVEYSVALVYRAFKSCNVECVSIWRTNGTFVEIPHGWSHPSNVVPDPKSLRIDEGIAGSVLKDGRMHYVPRMGIPFNLRYIAKLSFRFPHAIVLTIEQSESGLPSIRSDNVAQHEVYLTKNWRNHPVRSFLVLPLIDSTNACLGVLSIDFRKTDPLGIDELKSAAILATVIGNKLCSISTASGNPPLP